MASRSQGPRSEGEADNERDGLLPPARQEGSSSLPSAEETLFLKELVQTELERAASFPERVGQYRILRRISEGATAVVYEAEQHSPQRRVALKVMRQGHLVDAVHAQMFRREAETLGRLRHPHIADIYESGHTVEGQDYFAMELVRGQTLEAWLAARPERIKPEEQVLRLGLFKLICEAVHYAHQRGVIHRDLKPSNIVVTQEAESTGSTVSPPPALKILDFGLARITDEVQPAPLMSEIGVIKGTLAYMSPEQARGEGDAIDVRTDVYALGVILYEMLAGGRPYDLHDATLIDAVRVICEEPPRPLGQAWQGVRSLDPDLETIINKALAKEPEQRFGSALALAEDIQRHLSSQPIMARRPSAAYRARKFIQRHRVGVAASFLVLTALLLGIAGTSAGLMRARRAEIETRQKAESAERVSRFIADMLASVDPQQVGLALQEDLERQVGKETGDSTAPGTSSATASFRTLLRDVSWTEAGRQLLDRAILARAGALIPVEFRDDGEVAGQLELTLGRTYERLGLYEPARLHAERAVASLESALGPHAPETLRARATAGTIAYHLGRGAEADELLTEAHAAQARTLGAEHPDTLRTSLGVAWVLRQQGKYAQAERLLERTVAAQQRLLGDEHPHTIDSLNTLAVLCTDQDRYADAEVIHRQLLEARSRLCGPSHPDTLKSMTNLGVVSFHQGRLDMAEAMFNEVLETYRQVLGPEHPSTLTSATNLAIIYDRQQRPEESEKLHRESLEIKSRVLGPEHPETLSSAYNLALALTSQARYDEAEALHVSTLEARLRVLGDGAPPVLESLVALAGVAALRGDREEALAYLRRTVEAGYSRADALASDTDLASLREDPELLALLERARANATAAARQQ